MLSKFSVKRPYTIVVAVIMILILGGISFANLRTDLLPDIDLPYALIVTTYPGASPEEVELVVTKPVEQLVATVNNIKNVSSISRENSSVVILEFNNDVNMDSAAIDINSLLDLIKPSWPDTVGTPMVMRLNPDMLPIMVASVDVKDMDLIETSQLVEEKIIPELESVNGVASVSGVGLLMERVEVLLSSEKIDGLNTKILEKVDGELAEVEEELNKARKEIEDGKAKLSSEEKKQKGRLSQGEKAIASGKQKIWDGEAMISAGEEELSKVQKELESKLAEVTQKEKELHALKLLMSEFEEKLPKMEDDEIRGHLSGLLEGLPDEIKAKVEPEILELSTGIEEERDNRIKKIQDFIDGLNREIDENLELISAGKGEIEAGLQEVAVKQKEVSEKKLELSKGKDTLAGKEQELTAGKLMLSMEMDKARTKLELGEATLEEKTLEFEKARDEAFKKASLEGALTQDMISKVLGAQNFSMPAGFIKEEGTDYLVKVGDKIGDIEELNNLVLFDTGEEAIGKVYLKDVADISLVDNSEDIYAKVNGNDAVMLTFQKQSTFSTAQVSSDLRKKIEEITEDYDGLTITSLMDQGMYIDIVIDSVLKNVIYGGLLAILILLLFLRDIKPTFIIAVSIPISLIFAIAMMYFTGVTINIISLAGLALGVGMLVDNSIVAIENIYRLRYEGKTAREASIEGAREISGAIFASTLTTACVFLPIVFIKGISRQLFVDMGLTITYSLFASLITALTLVPAMASNMLKTTNDQGQRSFKGIIRVYEKMLSFALSHRVLVMTAVVVLLAFSIYLGFSMGTAYIPEMDAPQMSATIDVPKYATFKDTAEMTDRVVDGMLTIDGVKTVGAFKGQFMEGMGTGGDQALNSVFLYILLDEDKDPDNERIVREINKLSKELDCPIHTSSSNMDMSALGGSAIEVMIKGRDIDKLIEISGDITSLAESTEGTVDVSQGIEGGLTEVKVTVDKDKAIEEGLTVAQIFANLRTMLDKDRAATTLTIGNRDYPVVVLSDETKDLKRDELKDLTIRGEAMGKEKGGEIKDVPLGDIAEISEGDGLSSIKRDSQERYISVTINIDPDHNIGLVGRDLTAKLEDYELPDGYSMKLSGENKLIKDSLRDLTYMLLLAIAFIYLIMVAQFQSLLSPFIVMFTIPLAFTGGLMALAITGYEISLISMLGFLVLSGVVVNNGIVFVDFTNQLRESGLDKKEALMVAGRTRLKPILMTAITTILGLSTLSLGVGMGAEMLQPLAIVAIGGLTYATLLTLLVIPVMYDILHKDPS